MLRVTVTGLEYYRERFAKTPWVIRDAMYTTARELRPRMLDIISEAFGQAADMAEGFPHEYIGPLMRVIQTKDVDWMEGADGFSVFFDFDKLGTYDDLIEGAHYKAVLADGRTSEIPYKGAELKNPVLKRYYAWLRLDEGSRQDTYEKRAKYWESKGLAPQWLLLNNGQTLYQPYIQPAPIIETIEAWLGYEATRLFREVINREFQNLWGHNYIPTPTTYGAFKKRPGYEYIRVGNKMAGSRKIRDY
jgi:hypothetical protein